MMKILVLTFVSLALFSGCSSSDDAAVVAEGATAVFTKATAALSSFTGIAGVETLSAARVTCSDSGEPTTSFPGDALHAKEVAFCSIASNSKSPDTIQGSYFLVSAVLCAVEKSISFQYATGATYHDGVTFNENDSCFGTPGFDANEDGDFLDQITVSLEDKGLTGADYDYYIGIQLGATAYAQAVEPDVRFYLKDSGGIQAARVFQLNGQSIFELVMNSNTNSIYYENKDYGNERHIRLSVRGAFSPTTGSFSTVTEGNFIQTQGTPLAGVSSIMFFDGTNDSYDHHVNDIRDADYTSISAIPYNDDFYTWGGRSINSHAPETDIILDLSTFGMAF